MIEFYPVTWDNIMLVLIDPDQPIIGPHWYNGSENPIVTEGLSHYGSQELNAACSRQLRTIFAH
jgi:hypothetical protein